MAQGRAIILWLAFAALVSAVALVTLRVDLAQSLVSSQLAGLGLERAEARVESLGLASAEIRDVRLGRDGEFEVARVEAHYSAAGLLAGRLDTVLISGVRVQVSADAEGISLGSLDALLEPGAESETTTARGSGSFSLPVQTLRIEDARITAALPGGPVDVDASASLSARAEGSVVDFKAVALTAGERLRVEAEGEFDPVRMRGEAKLRIAPLRFEPDGLQPAAIHPVFREWVDTADGAIEGSGSVVFEDGALKGVFDLAIVDLSVALPLLAVDRVNAAVRVEGPWPPTTTTEQVLSIARVDFGLELTDGVLRFHMRPDGSVDLTSADWRFAGGSVHTSGRLDPAAEEQSLVLEVAGVDLAELSRLVPLEGLSAEGTIEGRIPIFRHGDRLEIRNALLSATPEGGFIRYRPDAGVASMAASGQGFDQVLGALENFRFESLRLTLDGDTHSVVNVGLHLRGSNPDYHAGHPVEFNLELESHLVDLLRKGSVAYEIPAEIEKRMQEIAEGR